MTTDAKKTVSDIGRMRATARYYFEKDDTARAKELARNADELLGDLILDAPELADLYAGMAALWTDMGEDDRAEHWIVKALELEASSPERRPITLGTQHLFYAQFLFQRRRFAEAAKHAREGIAIYAEGVEPGDRELAFIRRDMERVLNAVEEEPS